MIRVFHSRAISDTIEASGGMDVQIRLAENIRALRRQHRFTQEQLAESLGVADRVDFLGWVAGANKDRAFRQVSIFCLPSYAEGFPMAVLDAWAYALPVAATPVGGLPDIVSDGEDLMLFNGSCP